MSKDKLPAKLKDYDLVKDRIDAYIEEYPDYRVETEVVFASKPNADVVIVKAYVYRSAEEQINKTPHGTGIAEETRDAGYVNKTSHVENAETSAIGRALANVAFKIGEKRPSAEEMQKVERTKTAKKEKKKEKKEKADKVPEDEIEEKIKGLENFREVVKFFNTERDKRQGEERKKFEEKYHDLCNERIAELKN